MREKGSPDAVRRDDRTLPETPKVFRRDDDRLPDLPVRLGKRDCVFEERRLPRRQLVSCFHLEAG